MEGDLILSLISIICRAIAGLMLLAIGAAAQADITANYASADARRALTVEVADNGAMRFTDKDGSYILIEGDRR